MDTAMITAIDTYPVYTYNVCRRYDAMKNITLAIDETLLNRGRSFAQRRNLSFNAFVRGLIEKSVQEEPLIWTEDAFALMDAAAATPNPAGWSREDLYRV